MWQDIHATFFIVVLKKSPVTAQFGNKTHYNSFRKPGCRGKQI